MQSDSLSFDIYFMSSSTAIATIFPDLIICKEYFRQVIFFVRFLHMKRGNPSYFILNGNLAVHHFGNVKKKTAKASLIQMLVIVFRRMEADSSTVPIQPIVVAELMEPTEKTDADGTMTMFVQGFITKIMQDIDGVLNPGTPRAAAASSGAHDGAFETKTSTVESTNPADLLDSTDKDMLDAKYWEISMYKTALEGRKGELVDGEVVERDDDLEVQIGNKLRRDAFLVFRALCKLSMKTPPKEALADPQLMRGKIVALELLKILLENAGAIFRTSERYYIDVASKFPC